ncbi:MAG: glycosyltransferase family 4 protein [Casimicrobium sp.]
MTHAPHRNRALIALNTAWNLANFRVGLIRSLQDAGHEVVAAAPSDGHELRLPCRFVDLPMDNGGTNPVRDFALFVRFVGLLRRERPSVLLAFTAKPNIYGSLAARVCGVPVINNIAGLGSAVIRGGWVARVLRVLYRVALARSAMVFFQNPDDRDLFVREGIVRHDRVGLLPGSGVDLARFAPVSAAAGEARPLQFLLMARLLWDKGLAEYVEAARIVRAACAARGVAVEFCVAGQGDIGNPSAVPREALDRWVAEGVVRYLGFVEDVRPLIAAADVVVLPSYREGTPRALLEAAAMGKPLVATDVPGCREAVRDGETGVLCAARDARGLAEAMLRMIEAGADGRARMGRAGRAYVEAKFDERLVYAAYADAIATALARG